MEGPKFDAPVNIATYMNILLTCLFYSPIIPHTIPFACLGTCWTYWVWKISFLRIQTRPAALSTGLAYFWADMLPYITLGWSLSFMFFIE